MLAAVPSGRLEALAGDAGFRDRLARAEARLDEHLTAPSWYDTLPVAPQAIAYFSPEFGLSEALPQYSGGLGILAGDHLKAASDLGVPIVGIGLFYRNGYFRQLLTAKGAQEEEFADLDPALLPLSPVLAPDGSRVHIEIPLPGAVLHAVLWRVDVGRVPLLLLDADVPDNAPAERAVTDRLYGGDNEHRLRQEILLGIGGVKALSACGIEPAVFHMNEGHAGFLGIERVRRLVAEGGTDPEHALQVVRARTVFTTHTPVPAGIDRFPHDLMARYFGEGGVPTGLPLERLLALGAEAGGDPGVFNMAALGIRMAARVNGVSRLHGGVARAMFAPLFPGVAVDRRPDRPRHERRACRDVGRARVRRALPGATGRRLRRARRRLGATRRDLGRGAVRGAHACARGARRRGAPPAGRAGGRARRRCVRARLEGRGARSRRRSRSASRAACRPTSASRCCCESASGWHAS